MVILITISREEDNVMTEDSNTRKEWRWCKETRMMESNIEGKEVGRNKEH